MKNNKTAYKRPLTILSNNLQVKKNTRSITTNQGIKSIILKIKFTKLVSPLVITLKNASCFVLKALIESSIAFKSILNLNGKLYNQSISYPPIYSKHPAWFGHLLHLTTHLVVRHVPVRTIWQLLYILHRAPAYRLKLQMLEHYWFYSYLKSLSYLYYLHFRRIHYLRL